MKYCHRTQWMSEWEVKRLNEQKDSWERDHKFQISNDSIWKMNKALVESINNMVGEDDILWELGDWSFSAQLGRQIRKDIRCKTIHHIWGNHDPDGIADNFESTNELLEIGIHPADGRYWIGHEEVNKAPKGAQRITLCHYAMLTWNKSHRGAWQLYGHSHAGIEKWCDKMMPDRLSVDVGVDNAKRLYGEYRPFSFDDLQKLFKGRTGKVFGVEYAKEN
jgi:calcineurin-like phosphoesterase family protein